MSEQHLLSLLTLIKQTFFENDKAARQELAEWYELIGDTVGAAWLQSRLWVVRYRSRNNLDITVGPYLSRSEAEEKARELSMQLSQHDRAWVGVSPWMPNGNRPTFRSVEEVTIQ